MSRTMASRLRRSKEKVIERVRAGLCQHRRTKNGTEKSDETNIRIVVEDVNPTAHPGSDNLL